jgi:hypothetical protein
MWTEDGLLSSDVDKHREEEEAATAVLHAAMPAGEQNEGAMHSQAHRDAVTEMAAVARRRERQVRGKGGDEAGVSR